MRSAPRVLVAEDDESLRDVLVAVLRQHGYEVFAASDGRGALDGLGPFRPDLALLDIALPGDLDGLAVAETVRSAADIPIMFLTASDSESDTLAAFRRGADDYVTKPFSLAELLARMRAVLRRSGRLVSGTIEVRDVVIDSEAGTAWRAGHELGLTLTEGRLLERLAATPGEVVSKVQLLSELWGFDQFSPNLVEVHVSSLRRKLEQYGPRLIFTERGAGYVIRP